MERINKDLDSSIRLRYSILYDVEVFFLPVISFVIGIIVIKKEWPCSSNEI